MEPNPTLKSTATITRSVISNIAQVTEYAFARILPSTVSEIFISREWPDELSGMRCIVLSGS
jgi:hypothetical protein